MIFIALQICMETHTKTKNVTLDVTNFTPTTKHDRDSILVQCGIIQQAMKLKSSFY